MALPRRSRTSALPLVTAGAGALLATLAVSLALLSNQLLRDALQAECRARAEAVVRAVAADLDGLASRAAAGEAVPEAAAVWVLGAAGAGEPLPPPRWVAETRAYRGTASLPLAYVDPDGRPRAATWLPAVGAPSRPGPRGAEQGVLVEWDLEGLRQGALAARLAEDSERTFAAVVGRDEAVDALPFRPRALIPLAAPLAHWRVAVGLRDAGALRRDLRLQTALLGLVAVVLLALLGGSLYLYVRRQRERVRDAAAREQFLARATHELQTPLALLRAAAETIARGAAAEPEDQERCLAIVAREEERLTRAVRRLLRYLRLQAADGSQAEALLGRVAPLGEVVAQAADEARPALEAAGIALEVAIPVEVAGWAAPGELLRDTITELLANATKHAAGATRIVISGQRRGAVCVVTLEDDGPGVADSDALFEPWRAGGAGGTGLGLALLREGWALAGGAIALRPAVGATFEVTLPASPRGGR